MSAIVPLLTTIGSAFTTAAPAIGAASGIVGTGLAITSAISQKKQVKKQASLLTAQQTEQTQTIEETLPSAPAASAQAAQAGQEAKRRAIRRRVPTILTSGQGLAKQPGIRTLLGG